jgi:spermidine synthase
MASAPRDRALLLAFFLSGCAALGYELLWTQLLGLALGSEILAVLGVLAGFFGGMAAGSAMLHDRAVRSPNPARLFAGLEAIAAAYALLSPYILYGLADLLPPLIGEVAGNNDSPLALILSMGVTALALLPGTFCMGATLPALVEARRRSAPDDPEGRGVGRLYAANTAGATAGVLLTVYFILPALGMAFGSAL